MFHNLDIFTTNDRPIIGDEYLGQCKLCVSKRKLNVAYNSIVRYVHGLRKYDRISAFSSTLYGVSFDNLCSIRVLLFLHKIIYSHMPNYLLSKLTFARSVRGKKLISLRCNSNVSEYHFFLHAVRLWNSLSPTLQLNCNAVNFRNTLFNNYA